MNEEEHLVKVEEMKKGYTGQAIPPFQLFAEDNIKKMTTWFLAFWEISFFLVVEKRSLH
jgi:hypothetical protein